MLEPPTRISPCPLRPDSSHANKGTDPPRKPPASVARPCRPRAVLRRCLGAKPKKAGAKTTTTRLDNRRPNHLFPRLRVAAARARPRSLQSSRPPADCQTRTNSPAPRALCCPLRLRFSASTGQLTFAISTTVGPNLAGSKRLWNMKLWSSKANHPCMEGPMVSASMT